MIHTPAEYKVDHIIPNDIIRVEFRLGFRVEPKDKSDVQKVVEDLVTNREVNITSRYESLERNNVVGDFQFIVMEKYLSQDNELAYLGKHGHEIIFLVKRNQSFRRKRFWIGCKQCNG